MSMGRPLKVEIRLFATFRDFLPAGADKFSFTRDFERGTTVGEVMGELKLPDDVPKIIIVNGTHAKPEYVLEDGDVVSLFPPAAGG
jgi:sulfur carrier protein